MERIASFGVNHDRLEKGMYLSRTDFGDIYTYDIRMKKPNGGDYLSAAQAHSLEHLLATYARNSSAGAHIIYVGPMGCLTGMYLVTKGLPHEQAIALVQAGLGFIAGFEGQIPGATRPECGNFALQDLPGARAVAKDMLKVLEHWTTEKLEYESYLE